MAFNTASGIAVAEYLASTVGNVFDSATIEDAVVTTVDSLNNKYLNKGVVLAKINTPSASSGLVGPYSEAATDGRELDHNIVGINDTFADLTDGNKNVGVLVVGTVKESKVVMSSYSGSVPQLLKDKLRNSHLDIIFRAE